MLAEEQVGGKGRREGGHGVNARFDSPRGRCGTLSEKFWQVSKEEMIE